MAPPPPSSDINERQAQKSYWQQHSSVPTVEAMMLDSKAAVIDTLERPEVLSLLGDMDDKRVVELGAGIGRFTGDLARTARSVLAMDFMEASISENQRNNGHHKNIVFKVGDVTELQLAKDSCEVVFSNWLLMYLSDDEVSQLARSVLDWLTEGGAVFFRESCFHASGDKSRTDNPTHYRNPREYFALFDKVEAPLDSGDGIAHFELVNCKCIDTYVRVKHNQNQICWKWTKVIRRTPRAPQFRWFLDGQQYTQHSIRRYETIFGHGFVSTGGQTTTEELVKLLDLQPGQKVLDVGCGIGGGAFYMASTYGVHVHGMDLSVNMIMLALERAVDQGQDVTFEVADCTQRVFPEGSFDVVYSRDTLLHIHEKPLLFERLFRWLRPGGQLLITDYCKSSSSPSKEFAAYISQRGYDLHTVEDYGAMISRAGFEVVAAEDRTEQFQQCLTDELSRLAANKDTFIAEFSEADYQHLVTGWQDKMRRVKAGEQRWGLFRATKPLDGSPRH